MKTRRVFQALGFLLVCWAGLRLSGEALISPHTITRWQRPLKLVLLEQQSFDVDTYNDETTLAFSSSLSSSATPLQDLGETYHNWWWQALHPSLKILADVNGTSSFFKERQAPTQTNDFVQYDAQALRNLSVPARNDSDDAETLTFVFVIPCNSQDYARRMIMRSAVFLETAEMVNFQRTHNVRLIYQFFIAINLDDDWLSVVLEEIDQFRDIFFLIALNQPELEQQSWSTYKLLTMLKWASDNVPNADMVFRIDLRMFINVQALVKSLTKVLRSPAVRSGQQQIYIGQPVENKEFTATQDFKWHSSDWPFLNPSYGHTFFIGFSGVLATSLAMRLSDICAPNLGAEENNIAMHIRALIARGWSIDILSSKRWWLTAQPFRFAPQKQPSFPSHLTVIHRIDDGDVLLALYQHVVHFKHSLKFCPPSLSQSFVRGVKYSMMLPYFIAEIPPGVLDPESPLSAICLLQWQPFMSKAAVQLAFEYLQIFEQKDIVFPSTIVNYNQDTLCCPPDCYINVTQNNSAFLLNKFVIDNFRSELQDIQL